VKEFSASGSSSDAQPHLRLGVDRSPLSNSSEAEKAEDEVAAQEAHDAPYRDYAARVDRAQAMGVLKLMLDEEESAKRVRDAIADRPGVVESIVDVATLAPPPHEEAALRRSGFDAAAPPEEALAVRAANAAIVGLSDEARELAATAVVHVLEGGSASGAHQDDDYGHDEVKDAAPPLDNKPDGVEDDDDDDDDDDADAAVVAEAKKEHDDDEDNEDALEGGDAAGLPVDDKSLTTTTTTQENDGDDEASTSKRGYTDDSMGDDFSKGDDPAAEDVDLDLDFVQESSQYADTQRKRRQLAALATIRNLVTTPSESAAQISEARVQEMERASLRAVRSAGGVDAVVELLGDDDPLTQASASATLRALVRADDEAQRHRKQQLMKLRETEDIAQDSDALPLSCDVVEASSEVALFATTTTPEILASSKAASSSDENEPSSAREDESSTPLGPGLGGALLSHDEGLSVSSSDHPGGVLDDGRGQSTSPEESEHSLRAELAMSNVAVPRLVSVLSKGMEQPGAAVQAAATLVELVEGDYDAADAATELPAETASTTTIATAKPLPVAAPAPAPASPCVTWDQSAEEATTAAVSFDDDDDDVDVDVYAKKTAHLPLARAAEENDDDDDDARRAADAADAAEEGAFASCPRQPQQQQHQPQAAAAAALSTKWEQASSSSQPSSQSQPQPQSSQNVSTYESTKQQLKRAIAEDSSVIAAIVDLLQGALEVGETATPAVHSLAETLRAVASSDLVNQMRIRDAGGVRPLIVALSNMENKTPEIDETEDVVGEDAFSLGPQAPAPAAPLVPLSTTGPSSSTSVEESPAKSDAGGRRAGGENYTHSSDAFAKAWLSSSDQENNNNAPPRDETHVLLQCRSTTDTVAAVAQKAPAASSLFATKTSVDDIGVRFGSRPAEFSHESDRERILQQPFGFRRWFLTHTVTESAKQRAADARRDRVKLASLLDSLRAEVASILSSMNDQQQGDNDDDAYTVDEPLVQRYDRVQRELTYVTALLANVDRECQVHDANLTYESSQATNDPDYAIAELHLLESTFAVLGEINNNQATTSS